jgi:hypothetical protein
MKRNQKKTIRRQVQCPQSLRLDISISRTAEKSPCKHCGQTVAVIQNPDLLPKLEKHMMGMPSGAIAGSKKRRPRH